jgi:hypothetical protein
MREVSITDRHGSQTLRVKDGCLSRRILDAQITRSRWAIRSARGISAVSVPAHLSGHRRVAVTCEYSTWMQMLALAGTDARRGNPSGSDPDVHRPATLVGTGRH